MIIAVWMNRRDVIRKENHPRYLRFHYAARIYTHIRRNDEARRGLSAPSEMQFARACKYTYPYTHAWICSRTFAPSLCFRAFLSSLRHETHTPCRATHFEFVRFRAIASTGKWHLNPSIIPHVIPLPMKFKLH